MNRRSFLKTLLAGTATFAVLPSANTYARQWVKTEQLYVLNSDWINAEYEIAFIANIQANGLPEIGKFKIVEFNRKDEFPEHSIFMGAFSDPYPVRFNKDWQGNRVYVRPVVEA